MYELHVYGGDNIEESKDTFPSEKKAMEAAEMMSTDDTTNWKNKDDAKILVDYNNSEEQENLVIMKVSEV